MSLYTVRFLETNGYRYHCRVRAAGLGLLEIVELAVRKVWGDAAAWQLLGGTTGRVVVRVDDMTVVAKTGETQVLVEPATRRRATPSAV